MKKRSIKTLLVAAITLAAMSVPTTANAQFGGLVKKAKDKAKEKVEQVVDKKKNEAVEKGKEKAKEAKNDAKMKVLDTQRPELPWIMGLSKMFDDQKKLEEFAEKGLRELSDEEVIALRESMFARYKSDKQLLLAMKEGQIDDYNLNQSIEKEIERFHDFYNELEFYLLNMRLNGVKGEKLEGESATMKYENASYCIFADKTTYTATQAANGNIYFRKMLGGERAFLKAEALKEAKSEIDHVRKIILVSQGIGNLAKETGDKPEDHGFLPFMADVWVGRMNAAMANNTPENIEYRAMPKAGAMQAKFKSEALAIAKADDPKVIDVVITSDDWDVLMKGLVPERRNIYGYYITQDEHGKICSERVWTQKYQGNGSYGKLKAGGVGVSADFYVK